MWSSIPQIAISISGLVQDADEAVGKRTYTALSLSPALLNSRHAKRRRRFSRASRCGVLLSISSQSRLFFDDPEFRASILGPGLLIVSGNGWSLFPIAYG